MLKRERNPISGHDKDSSLRIKENFLDVIKYLYISIYRKPTAYLLFNNENLSLRFKQVQNTYDCSYSFNRDLDFLIKGIR